jgi:hypothetical protein
MSTDNATKDNGADRTAAEKDAHDRKAAADALRRQIENLKVGMKPRSLNEFIENRMAEDKKKQR